MKFHFFYLYIGIILLAVITTANLLEQSERKNYYPSAFCDGVLDCSTKLGSQ